MNIVIDFEKSCKENNTKRIIMLMKIKNFRSLIPITKRYNLLKNLCTKSKSYDVVEVLIKSGNFDASKNRNKILLTLIENYNFKMFKIIIENSKNIDLSSENYIIYTYAAYFNRISAFKLLMKKLDNINGLFNAIDHAITRRNIEILQEIIRYKGLNVNFAEILLQKMSEYPIFYDIFKELLELNIVNPSFNNNILLRKSICNIQNIPAFKLLLADPRVDPTSNNYEAIKNILSFGINVSTDILKIIIADKRVNLSFGRNILIKNLVLNNQIELARIVINDKRVRKILTKTLQKQLENKKIIPYYESRNSRKYKSSKRKPIYNTRLVITDN